MFMPRRSTKPAPPTLSPEDRDDLALLRKRVREMEESGEPSIPWEEMERRLAALSAEEDAERERKRRTAFGSKPAKPEASRPKRPSSVRKAQR
jgi:hypothetical protein